MATQEIINIGINPSNRKGDPIRVAFAKTNNNFFSLSALDISITLTPINIELEPGDDPTIVLKEAFKTTNENFANLNFYFQDYELIDIEKDDAKTAFIKINNNFANLITLTDSLPVTTNFVESQNTVDVEYEIYAPKLYGSSLEVVNIGAAPNDGTGDPLRTAFSKINNNFANLFSTIITPTTANTSGNTANQVIFSTEIANFSQAQFNIRSSDEGSNSQNILITAQINNSNNNVKFSAYGTTFFGSAICRYDMDMVGSNVRVLCTPFNSGNLTHLIFSQIMQQV